LVDLLPDWFFATVPALRLIVVLWAAVRCLAGSGLTLALANGACALSAAFFG
jgi:hypothetical protein